MFLTRGIRYNRKITHRGHYLNRISHLQGIIEKITHATAFHAFNGNGGMRIHARIGAQRVRTTHIFAIYFGFKSEILSGGIREMWLYFLRDIKYKCFGIGGFLNYVFNGDGVKSLTHVGAKLVGLSQIETMNCE